MIMCQMLSHHLLFAHIPTAIQMPWLKERAPPWGPGPPRTGMGVDPDWYGGHPGLVWGSAE